MPSTIITQYNPFAQISKTMLADPQLSWKSKGLLSFIFSQSLGTSISVDDLVASGLDGKSAVRSAIKELKALGYASLRAVRENGRISHWQLDFTDKGGDQ